MKMNMKLRTGNSGRVFREGETALSGLLGHQKYMRPLSNRKPRPPGPLEPNTFLWGDSSARGG